MFEIREFMPEPLNLGNTDNEFIAPVTLLNGQSAERPTTITVYLWISASVSLGEIKFFCSEQQTRQRLIKVWKVRLLSSQT